MPLPTTVNTPRPRSRGFGCQLDEIYLRLSPGEGREMVRQTAPLQAERTDTRINAEEFVTEYGDLFIRSEFTGGEGLDKAHRRDLDALDTTRYWDSRGIYVTPSRSGRPSTLSLLHDTTNIDSSANAGLRLAFDGTNLLMASGTSVRVTPGLLDTTPPFSSEDPHDGEGAQVVHAVACYGTTTYAALGTNGIHERVAGTWGHYNDLQADNLWVAKGRVLATATTSLYEVTASGAAPGTALRTLAPGQTWTDVADGGDAILASATDGYIYAFTVDDTSTLTLRAQTLVEGEQVVCVGAAQGVVAYGTRQPTTAGGYIGRLWTARLADSGTLVDAQVLREWGDADTTVDHSPRKITSTRDAFYVAVPASASRTDVWRYELADAGLHRHVEFAASGVVRGLLVYGGRVFATVDGSGLWRESTDLVSEGWLIGPLGDFFSAEPKEWVGARLETATLATGEQVDFFYATDPAALLDADSNMWVRVSQTASGQPPVETPMVGVTSRWLAGMVRLSQTADTSPQVRSFGFRAYPSAQGVDVEWSLPVNVSDWIVGPNRRPMFVRGRGDLIYAELKRREGRAARLHIFRPEETLRGVVTEVTAPSAVFPERGSPMMVAMLRFRGRAVSQSYSVIGETLGTGDALGLSRMG